MFQMILVGGHALNVHFPNQVPGANRLMDKDFICSYEEFEEWKRNKKFRSLYPIDSGKKMVGIFLNEGICEFELTWEGSTAESFIKLVETDPDTRWEWPPERPYIIPSLNALFALKCSHKYLRNSPHFLKTMNDINFMKSKGAVISDHYKAWFKIREKETYNYKHPNLYQKKKDFFDPNEVKYTYDHDTIHEAMANLDRPAYSYFKHDQADVACSKDKFFACDEMVRLYSVLEESYVLALERSQVPHKGKITPSRSFLIALEKVCTSISSGWWRAYAYDNYDKILGLYDPEYVNKFWKAVEEGRVKLA